VMVLIALLVVVAAGLYFSALSVRPLKKVVRAIDNSSRDSVGGDILVDDCAETQQISEAYNRMLDRLRTLDESRQQFVSNVSHELKTPITSIRVLADSLLAQEGVPVELYREFMSDISAEIDRESQIIDDLLTLVRMDKAAAELNISEVNINEMLEAILKRLRPLAMKRNVELLLESFRPVAADADEVKLNLAITNLVENAIKYNIDNGWVRVSLNADHQFFYIKVEDSGIGIPQQEWDHIFERFYRVDKARSRATGGTGLGLAITKNIIVLHHGAIRVNSVEGEGTTFTVRIPRTYRRQEGGM
ncbi:MAG: HAMP domain-containing protein, partial [Lachnospiraceae bacterium]|nr:HAMP domain-containing protein [Lachnospiraceae bacterium]